MQKATSLIAVGRESKCNKFFERGTWFLIQPALSSKKTNIFATERLLNNSNISFLDFASNDHILVQFKTTIKKDANQRTMEVTSEDKSKSVVFGPNGEMQIQKKEI